MIRITKVYLLLFCLPLLTHAQSGNLFDYKNSLDFANYLFRTNQFDMASVEYERILYMEPEDTLIKVKLLKSYRLGSNEQMGIQRVHDWMQSSKQDLPRGIGLEYSKLLIFSNNFSNLHNYLERTENKLNESDITFLEINSSLLQHNYQTARSLFTNNFEAMPEGSFDTYNGLIQQGLNMNYKSPALAAALSTVVPGTGRIYTGDWKDGLLSMLILGSVSYGSYRAFDKRGVSSALGWIYGSLGFGLYLGNIYGSYQSAKDFNSRKRNAFEERIKHNIRPYF